MTSSSGKRICDLGSVARTLYDRRLSYRIEALVCYPITLDHTWGSSREARLGLQSVSYFDSSRSAAPDYRTGF